MAADSASPSVMCPVWTLREGGQAPRSMISTPDKLTTTGGPWWSYPRAGRRMSGSRGQGGPVHDFRHAYRDRSAPGPPRTGRALAATGPAGYRVAGRDAALRSTLPTDAGVSRHQTPWRRIVHTYMAIACKAAREGCLAADRSPSSASRRRPGTPGRYSSLMHTLERLSLYARFYLKTSADISAALLEVVSVCLCDSLCANMAESPSSGSSQRVRTSASEGVRATLLLAVQAWGRSGIIVAIFSSRRA